MADVEEQSVAASYQPTMDLGHFRQLIQDAEQEHLVSSDICCVKDITKSGAAHAKHSGAFVMHNLLLFVRGVVSVCAWRVFC